MVFLGRHFALLALSSVSIASPVDRDTGGGSSIKVPISKKTNPGLVAEDIVKLDKLRGSSFLADAASNETAPVVNKDIVYSIATTVGTQVNTSGVSPGTFRSYSMVAGV